MEKSSDDYKAPMDSEFDYKEGACVAVLSDYKTWPFCVKRVHVMQKSANEFVQILNIH